MLLLLSALQRKRRHRRIDDQGLDPGDVVAQLSPFWAQQPHVAAPPFSPTWQHLSALEAPPKWMALTCVGYTG